MKTSVCLLILAFGHSALGNVVKRTTPTSACPADNCLRGVRGTGSNIKPPLTSRLADCSSFMRATATPAPTTTTITTATVTITVGPILPRGIEARQQTISPSQVPAYATFCPASSSYSSACSCLGITKTTTTVATPTLTEFAISTATYTPPACACEFPLVCGQGGGCSLSPAISCTGELYSECGVGCQGLCYRDVNGAGWCKVVQQCTSKVCETGADCESNVCLVNACGRVCYDLGKLCPNVLLPRNIFKRGQEGRVETRGLVESDIGLIDGSLLASP
ncbi:hypothetical protein DL98DRAFT_528825 [Cadophora sp. DSE1049]|nr:hypothetical protein DL98DRAFT_528825 [Cadophora sp. DSE1049]